MESLLVGRGTGEDETHVQKMVDLEDERDMTAPEDYDLHFTHPSHSPL